MIGCSLSLWKIHPKLRWFPLLADPLVLTIGGTATNFNRVSSSSKRATAGLVDQSVYRTSDGGYSITISEYFRTNSVIDRVAVSEFSVLLNRHDLTKSDKPITSVGITYRVTDGYTPDFTNLFSALSSYLTDTIRDRVVGGEN